MFNVGEFYRRSELHDEYGGNRQRGISNCPNNDLIFIFTKSEETQDVYVDEWRDDYFFYSGEGRVGDMEMTGGNKAIWNHEVNNKKIYLFKNTNQSGYWEYIDQLKLIDINYYRNLDENDEEREAFQFVLISVTREDQTTDENLNETHTQYNYNRPNRTERKGLVVTRVGQGTYRRQLLDRWENRCAVTNSSIKEILIASHIVPWRISNEIERVHVGNGILLSPNLDALFDRHLISFENDGTIIISEIIQEDQFSILGISREQRLQTVFPDMLDFLQRHREEFREKERNA
tara:strand:+ start:506 stop:1375 length:870 start_codon:yes stop_codon:yes gene_type:complete